MDAQPTAAAAGTIDLTDVLARGVKLGNGHLVVAPESAQRPGPLMVRKPRVPASRTRTTGAPAVLPR